MFAPCYGFHKLRRIESGRLYYEKGERERFWFEGTLEVCTITNCGHERFVGDNLPYARQMGKSSRKNNQPLHSQGEGSN